MPSVSVTSHCPEPDADGSFIHMSSFWDVFLSALSVEGDNR